MENNFLNQAELEAVHTKKDPWKYNENNEDQNRKNILLSELPSREYKNVLDIGCGQGFITQFLPGKAVVGVDVSHDAIKYAKELETSRLKFRQGNIFNLAKEFQNEKYDLIVITGVLYPPYIGRSNSLIYHIIDQLLEKSGILVSVHISEWYNSRFPYLLLSEILYPYREYYHKLEVYSK
jgi:2-polyprenyl-3-methyl-5-hydroxy-6-metoxy-1,4-benzoquinol methylase